MPKSAYVIHPITDPDVEYLVAGPFTMEQVLTIPSSNIIWKDEEAEAGEKKTVEDLIAERFPATYDERFTRAYDLGKDRYNPAGAKLLPKDLQAANHIHAVFRSPAFLSHSYGFSKEERDILFKEAKKRSVVMCGKPQHLYPLRQGFVCRHMECAPLQVLEFDKAHWEKARLARKERQTAEKREVEPRGFVLKQELRIIAERMARTLKDALAKKAVCESGWFFFDIKFDYRTKKKIINSIFNLYRLGTTVFGKTFWRRESLVLSGVWARDRYVRADPIPSIVARWKKKKIKRPKSERPALLYKIIQEIAAKPPAPKKKARKKAGRAVKKK